MDFPQPSGAPEQPARPVEFQTYPTPADLARYAEGKVRRRLYRDLKLLGSGAEGKVKLSENVETGELVALKSMAKPSMPALGMNMETLTDSMKAKLQVGSGSGRPRHARVWRQPLLKLVKRRSAKRPNVR